MGVARRVLAVGVVLTCVAALTGTVAFGVEEVERELDAAARSLEEIEAALEAAEREIMAAEERLRRSEAALAEVKEELAEARRAVADAEAVRRTRTRERERALMALAAAEHQQATALARLQDRSVEVFKYGAGRSHQALVAGVIGADDWHEVAVTTSAVGRIVSDDRTLLDEAVRSRARADEARTVARDAEVAALAAERQAVAEGAALETLVGEHEAALVAVEQEHARRAAVVAELEADSELTALLVTKLESELAKALQVAAAATEPEPGTEPEPEAVEAGAGTDPSSDDAPGVDVPETEERPEADGTGGSQGSDDPDGGRGSGEAEQPDTRDEPDPDSEGSSPPRTDEPAAGATDPPAWAARLPAVGRPWASDIDAAARAAGIDGRLLAALVWTESSFDPSAVSWAGAIGLSQLMPATARQLGVDPWDPHENLDGGARYLAAQHRRFGSLELALAAYNAGPGAVQRAGPGIPSIVETQLYVVRVLERYNALHGS